MKLEQLSPAFKDYLWGGTKLRDVYGKNCDFDKVAESWELSTHPAGESTLAGGDHPGLTLSQYFQQFPEVLGKNARAFRDFPVLIKLIDAKDPLSIQVHPSDEYALRVEGEYGKTEMWVIVDCEPGAFLYFGVNRPVSKEEFQQRIENNTVLEVLNKVEVRPGDVFFIQSGTIHAIGAGILICEIQQNSNCTYRVYDYGRRAPGAAHRQGPGRVQARALGHGQPFGAGALLRGGHGPNPGGVPLFLHREAAGGGGTGSGGRGGQLYLPVVREGRRPAGRAGKRPGVYGGGQPVRASRHRPGAGLRGGGAGENHRACPRGMTAQPPFQAERLRRWMDET